MHSEGRRFDPCRLHQKISTKKSAIDLVTYLALTLHFLLLQQKLVQKCSGHMKGFNMKLFLLCLTTLFITACELPSAYQGTFVSSDGSFQVVIDSASIQLPNTKLKSFFTGGSVFSSLSKGETGVYVAPSIYFTMMGRPMHAPQTARMGWPGVMYGYEESKDKYDVFIVTKTQKENTGDLPIPQVNANLYRGEVFFFQADKNQSARVNEIDLQYWKNSSLMAYEIKYGPMGLVKTWQISGGEAQTLKLFRK